MAKLYNRQPLQFNKANIKNYQFLYSNFKGINENKNFTSVDQESFADAKNVYVNDIGLLCSRPALVEVEGLNFYIVNFWSFGNIIVYLVKENSNYKIHIYDDDQDDTIVENVLNENVTIVEIDNKIIIFSKFNDEYIKYYDKEDKTLKSADDLLYIPNITAYSELVTDEIETVNLLTSKQIKTFLDSPETGISPDVYSYEEVKYKITTPISENYVTINTTYPSLEDRLIDYAFLFGNGEIIVSPSGQVVYIDIVNKQIRYSPDGLTFTKTYSWSFDSVHSIAFTTGTTDTGYDCSISLTVGNQGKTYRLDNKGDVIYSNESSIEIPMSGRFVSFIDDSEYYVKRYNSSKYFLYLKGKAESNGNNVVTSKGYLPLAALGVINLVRDGEFIKFITIYEDKCVLDSLALWTNKELDASDVKDGTTILSDSKLLGFTPNTIVYHEESDGNLILVRTEEDPTHPAVGGSYSTSTVEFHVTPTADTIWSVSDDKLIFTNCTVNGEKWECGVFEYSGNIYPIVLPDYNGNITTVGIGNKIFVAKQKDSNTDVPLYRSGLNRVIELQAIVDGEQQDIANKFTHTTTLNEHYFSVDNCLYITEYREENTKFKLYLPEISKQQFNSKILGLAPISDTLVAIFTENDIWYVEHSEDGYRYYRSRLKLMLSDDLDVVTDSTGTNTLLCDKNGLVTLSYQAMMSTSEQGISQLSSPISSRFNNGKINKLLVFKHWINCYDGETPDVYLFDIRNSSWWHFDFGIPVNKMGILMNDEWDNEICILSNGKLYKLNYDNEEYFDVVAGEKIKINWFFKSQKLHLNAIDYHKHINNMTFYTVENTNLPVMVDLSVRNYRKLADDGKSEKFDYDISIIRTFVKKLNYFKVNEFEYELKADLDSYKQSALNLSNISIKYTIGNEVK